VRRGRPVRRRELPDGRAARGARHPGQVERGVRRARHADAPARPVSALACHCGDALFEACYLADFPKAVRALRDEYDGSYDAWWEDVRSRVFGTKSADWDLLEPYGYAACYSADDDGTVRLPFDTATGRIDDEVWARWLAWDPVRMIPQRADAMGSMRAVWLDAGRRDEFFLDNGMVAVSKELDKLGVEHTLELFDGGHMSIGYRYPESLAFLVRALAA
jgi:hypothetical protein